ncbi:hypothetical protein BV210_06615 [Halorientalis sp. IM1011]|uniref:DUF6114 domain-containing protein n=1 Tax=Halorientalis sp. IM1011 TaxID=1932360 RepID=UPI00097CD32A|nr:DUF6114 domain-containing protein [Halorientalis sp. IM1011]AQL42405.1 hypothetical protein BV210_06615 [Halorientalis sp. IM1011]
MSVRAKLWHTVPGPIRRRVDDRRSRFDEWKQGRPFLGALLLMIGGAVIGWVPIQFATELAIIGGSFTVIGLVFAAMVFLTGAFVMARPELSTIFGVIGIALSILSLIGALGGLFVGMLIGIIGGNLCVAWRHPDPDPSTSAGTTGSPDTGANEDVQFSWQGDQ